MVTESSSSAGRRVEGWTRVLEGAEMGRHSSAVAMRAHPEQQAGRSPAVRASHQTPTGWASSLDLGLPNRPARDLADANRRDVTIRATMLLAAVRQGTCA